MKRTIRSIIFFLLITLLSLTLRLYGFNWDQGQHQHPDERFLTMVATDMKWPGTIKEYFDTKTSTLNPHNIGHSFYVYGTYPVILTKWVSDVFHLGDYAHINIVGRILVALIDTTTAILVFVTTRRITKKVTTGLLAMFIYTTMMLPIQLSHFFTVDPYTTFFTTLSFVVLTFPLSAVTALAIGMLFGLVVASKISGALFAGILVLFFLQQLITARKWWIIVVYSLIALLSCYCTLRLSYPILFTTSSFFNLTLNPKILANWKELATYSVPATTFPPGIQWIPTMPILFPLVSLIFLGLGIPTSLILIVSVFTLTKNLFRTIKTYLECQEFGIEISKFLTMKRISKICNEITDSENKKIFIPNSMKQIFKQELRYYVIFLMFLWIVLQFSYQGIQFTKSIRYFSSIYPFIAVIGGIGLYSFARKFGSKRYIFYIVIIFFSLLWPVMYMAIYSRPHTRVAASQWIYTNIPRGTRVGIEHWDDGLPLCLPYVPCGSYTSVELPMFIPDNDTKWIDIANKLSTIEYIFISSNRVYGALTGVPNRFPITASYYRALFDRSLGFSLEASFISRPTLPLPSPVQLCIHIPFQGYGLVANSVSSCNLTKGIQIIDDYTEETWTVYDHPSVYILKNTHHLSPNQLLETIYQTTSL